MRSIETTASGQVNTALGGSRDRTTVLVLVCLSLFIALLGFGDWAILSPDSYQYLEMARTIAETWRLPDTWHSLPPGYSLILAPIVGLGGELPLRQIRALSAICLAASVILTFHLYRTELGRNAAAIVAFCVATSSVLHAQSVAVLSESIFMPIFLLSILFMQRLATAVQPRRGAIFACGFLHGIAVLIRSIGIVLVPISLLVLAWQARRLRHGAILTTLALYLAGVSLTLAPWLIHQSRLEPGYGYVDTLAHPRTIEHTNATGVQLQLERFARFAPQRLHDITAAVAPNRLAWRLFQPPLRDYAAWLIGGGCVLVLALRLIRLRLPADATALSMLLVLAVWPWNEGARLVVPLVPILFAAIVWMGARLVSAVRKRPAIRACYIVMCSIVLLVHTAEIIPALQRLKARRPRAETRIAQIRDFAEWLDEHAPRRHSLVSILPDGLDTKTLVAGAGYLTRRAIHYVDVYEPGERLNVPVESDWVLVDESLISGLPELVGRTSLGRWGNFHLMAPL